MQYMKFWGGFFWILHSSIFLVIASYSGLSMKPIRRKLSLNTAVDETLSKHFSGKYAEILGFGSLLSPTSSKLTFPQLTDFRVVRVNGYRRIFRHPAAIFFERGIADLASGKIGSLTTEKASGCSFLAVVFAVSNVSADDFLTREEEFDFVLAQYDEIGPSSDSCLTKSAIMCTSSSDETYISRWGADAFNARYLKYGLRTIWGYDSGILPCSVYLRHCYLAAKNLGPAVLDSFLDETFLIDRKTTIRSYLTANPDVLLTRPPESLIGRYSG